jgi:tRNA A-37 threonylcarbamoyl transferase component Bud32
MRHRTADLEPTSFGGRYTLIRRLAVGGMAEIYLARQAAMAGFEKEVVIKRLRAELADDPRIVEMFLDEARIGALLNHPNIVHVYDVDEHAGIPYIAMEYIIGEELNELCRRGISHDKFLPLEHAVELIRQAAAGMGYFHAKKAADEALEIVHCDISPTNLMVTQDGFLKIIDFGIAMSHGQRHAGEGVMPGKLSYMSPEQAARGPVDHRSDVFSLGIVLYEITVGKRLFRGPAQEVVKRLANAEIEPPTYARRKFPPALEAIVMRTLEKHPGDRYQSAYDLADDLESFLRDEKLHSGPVRIARYLDMLAFAGGGQRRPELVSEAEAKRGDHDELDFDTQIFDGYKPLEGAPGPEQAPEWEEIEEPEAEMAAALGMELRELRALRTPVPARPAGMPEVDRAPDPPRRDDDIATNPMERVESEEADTAESAPPVTSQRSKRDAPKRVARPARDPESPAPVRAAFGASYLARSDSKMGLWVALGIGGVAVVLLIAYIVFT